MANRKKEQVTNTNKHKRGRNKTRTQLRKSKQQKTNINTSRQKQLGTNRTNNTKSQQTWANQYKEKLRKTSKHTCGKKTITLEQNTHANLKQQKHKLPEANENKQH